MGRGGAGSKRTADLESLAQDPGRGGAGRAGQDLTGDSWRTLKRPSRSLRVSTIPPYSRSSCPAMAGPKKPCSRISIALQEAMSRTRSQNGWSNASAGSANLPFLMEKATHDTIGGPSKKEIGEFIFTAISGPW